MNLNRGMYLIAERDGVRGVSILKEQQRKKSPLPSLLEQGSAWWGIEMRGEK